MKTKLFIFPLFALFACGHSELGKLNEATIDSLSKRELRKSPDNPTDSIIKLQVKLIDRLDTLKLPGDCGIFKFDITLNYEVIKVLQGHYPGKTILINHICPREAVELKMIENDRVYTYSLKRRFTVWEIKAGEQTKLVDAGDYEIIK